MSRSASPSMVYVEPFSRASRYFRTKLATPRSLSHLATLYPSWSIHNSACPPPGTTITAPPVAFSLDGKYEVIDGRFTVEITCSPSGVTRTDSSAVLPSEPGAPLGQRRITSCSTARDAAAANKMKNATQIPLCFSFRASMLNPQKRRSAAANLTRRCRGRGRRSSLGTMAPATHSFQARIYRIWMLRYVDVPEDVGRALEKESGKKKHIPVVAISNGRSAR